MPHWTPWKIASKSKGIFVILGQNSSNEFKFSSLFNNFPQVRNKAGTSQYHNISLVIVLHSYKPILLTVWFEFEIVILLSVNFCDRRLALSTNSIDRMIPLNGMARLKILSLGRNQIKKVRFFCSPWILYTLYNVIFILFSSFPAWKVCRISIRLFCSHNCLIVLFNRWSPFLCFGTCLSISID